MLHSIQDKLGLSRRRQKRNKHRYWVVAFFLITLLVGISASTAHVLGQGTQITTNGQVTTIAPGVNPTRSVPVGQAPLSTKSAEANPQTRPGCSITSPLICISELFLVGARLSISMVMFFLRFFIDLAGYNGFIDAKPVVVGWFLVRDLANMFFIVALLVIAFGTILGLEQYEWRKSLVKLILAAIFINFSRLICGLILDVSHVFMITFTNAIAGSAGSNVIQMFRLESILSLTSPEQIGGDGGEDFRLDLLAASIMAFMFAVTAMAAMAVYTFVLVARVVVLWVLIILSPLAFVLSAIPQGKAYAQEWWNEFSNNVIVGPIIVFFMWLALATIGNADIGQHIGVNYGNRGALDAEGRKVLGLSSKPKTSIAEIGTWENMSAFIVAIAFLFVGFERVMKTGARGTGLISGAQNFAKRVATIATGYAAGRWLVGKGFGAAGAGAGLVGKGLKTAGLHIPIIPSWLPHGKDAGGGWKARSLAQFGRYAKQEIAGVKAWAGDTGWRPKTAFNEETGRHEFVRYEEDQKDPVNGKILHRKGDVIMEQHERGGLQRFVHGRVASDVASRKRLEKTEKFANVRLELLDKRVAGVPKALFMAEDEQVDALDRVEQGMLEGEKARSEAKTAEFGSLGKYGVLGNQRFKDGKVLEDKGTMAAIVGQHEARAERDKALIERDLKEGKEAYRRTDEGLHLLHETEAAEFGAKASEEFIEGLKNESLKEAFKDARARIEVLIDKHKGKPDELFAAMQAEANLTQRGGRDMFFAQLVNSQLKGVSEIERKISERQAIDSAADGVVNIQRGSRMPSTAYADVAEQLEKEYSDMERVEGMTVAANKMTHLIDKRERGETLSEYDEATLKAAMNKIDSESWNDDVFDQIVQNRVALIGTGALSAEDEATAVKMERIFVSDKGLNWGERGKNGYDRNISADLQQLASVGGNLDAVKMHNKISDFHKKSKFGTDRVDGMTYEEIKAKEGYFGVARRMGAAGLLGKKRDGTNYTDVDLRTALTGGSAQDLMQQSTKQYAANGKTNGHYESVFNINHDNREGMHRFMTEIEGEEETIAEIVKKNPADLLRAQFHAFGQIDTKKGIPHRINKRVFRSALANVSEEYELKASPPRTSLAFSLYHKTEKPTQQKSLDGVTTLMRYGGDTFHNTIKDDTEANLRMVVDSILPQVTGDGKGFGLFQMRNGQHVNLDQIAHGKFNLALRGGVEIKEAEDIKKFIEANKAKVRLRLEEAGEDFDLNMKELDGVIAQAKVGKLVRTRGTTSPGKRSTP